MLIIIKGKVDAIGTNRLTAERKKMGINEINNVQLNNSLGSADREKQVIERGFVLLRIRLHLLSKRQSLI